MTPRISVIMTVFDPHPVYFPLAVTSILHQEFNDFELIIVEDPSSSRAADFLCQFDDHRIRHICNPARTSLVHQKNQGVAVAKADLLAMFDADDVSDPHRLGSQIDYMASHPDVDVLGTQINLIDDQDRLLGSRYFPLDHDSIVKAMHRIVPISHPSVMIRKSALLKAGSYRYQAETTAAEDYELWSRLIGCGARFANHPSKLIRYRLHVGQIKYRKLHDSIRAALYVKRMYWVKDMDLVSRLYMRGEQGMLFLPRKLVFHIFALMQYRFSKTPPENDGTLRNCQRKQT